MTKLEEVLAELDRLAVQVDAYREVWAAHYKSLVKLAPNYYQHQKEKVAQVALVKEVWAEKRVRIARHTS